jgi:hypothetical protein
MSLTQEVHLTSTHPPLTGKHQSLLGTYQLQLRISFSQVLTYQHQTGTHQPLTGTHLSLPVRLKPIRGTQEPLKYVSNRENTDIPPIIYLLYYFVGR